MSDRQTPNTIDPYLEAPAGALSAVPARPAGRCRQQPAADTEEAACGRSGAMTLGDAMTSGNRQPYGWSWVGIDSRRRLVLRWMPEPPVSGERCRKVRLGEVA